MQTLKRSSLLPESPGCLLTCRSILWPILKAFQEMLLSPLSSSSPTPLPFSCLNSLKFPCSLPSLGICTGFLSHLHKLLIRSIPTVSRFQLRCHFFLKSILTLPSKSQSWPSNGLGSLLCGPVVLWTLLASYPSHYVFINYLLIQSPVPSQTLWG